MPAVNELLAENLAFILHCVIAILDIILLMSLANKLLSASLSAASIPKLVSATNKHLQALACTEEERL